MKPEQLPKVENEEYNPNLDAPAEELTSGGGNRLMYVLVAIVVALVVGYVALPKGGDPGPSSATSSAVLDTTAAKTNAPATDATAQTSADGAAADFNSAADFNTAADPASTVTPTSASPSTVATATGANGFGEETTSTKEADKPAEASRTKASGKSARTSAAAAALSSVAPSSDESSSEPTPGPVAPPTTVTPVAPAAHAAPSATVIMSGHISDETGRPLVGATVLLKGSSKGTSTDASGNYSIEVPNGADNALIFGYAGYEDEVVRGTGAKFANVILTPLAKGSKKGKE
ncbi:carboxypeptidase-like regulatory domain-containing protein [Hymenobacter sp. BT664]|uniref:Carboxypeptidase-like regulatory domain-containing protein n=1 Tax=Hymenobacter montanus TaxID=2771359 RepID=A0A927GJL6_9BACT|nr:carboxypeptidase-like regulatory domain-containing protein [Hymenobacter montanus]MBD2768279.1 carboxypeptidase-like regulatory domain-containing protein [Hymenobacter montanus]